MTDFRSLLTALCRGDVEFIMIGGAAATVHGSARLTADLEVVYRRTAENVRRLVETLRPLQPYLRGAPAGLPFAFDEPTVKSKRASTSPSLRPLAISTSSERSPEAEPTRISFLTRWRCVPSG
jgi:hypothetical protein